MCKIRDTMGEENNPKNLVNCRTCKHFYITWDAAMPNGCRLYGMKTKQLPSQIVKESSGMSCLGHEAKSLKKDQNPYGE